MYLIDRNGNKKIYQQISHSLMEEINSRYQPGEFLPSEQELAVRYRVNRHTVRRAVDELVEAGLVGRRHGKGTIILEPSLDYSIGEGSRFTESLKSKGRKTDSAVLRKLVIPATSGIARRLNTAIDAPIIWIETLRKVDAIPFCIISHFIPQKNHQIIERDYNGGSLHRFINEKLQLQLRRTDSLITAVLAKGDDAHHLRMSQQTPVLRVKSLNVDVNSGRPVEYAITRFRSDRVQLEIQL